MVKKSLLGPVEFYPKPLFPHLHSDSPFNKLIVEDTTPYDNLNRDLKNLSSQLEQLQSEVAGKDEFAQIKARLNEITPLVQKASETGQELKANVLLPPPEYMDVQLVPSHFLERLEEYRSDEKKAYMLLGVFLGGVFGILSNWATQDTFVMTKAAYVLMCLSVILTICLGLWAWQTNRRVVHVKNRIFTPHRPEVSNRVSDQNVSPIIEKEDSEEQTVQM